MSERKKTLGRSAALKKEQWHIYSLQALPASKFVKITGEILRDYRLLVGVRSGAEYGMR